MIYSKTGKHYSHDYKYHTIGTLDSVDFTKDVTYYHHPYDRLQHGVKLSDCLDEVNWTHIRNNPSVKLIHNTDSETFEIYLVNDIVNTINGRKINPSQLEVVVMDENHKKFLVDQLAKQGVTGVTINVNNSLLQSITIPPNELPIVKKFSALSRNYRIWRLAVYAELRKRGLLDEFNYSFYNISPYVENPIPETVEKMLADLEKVNFGEIPKKVSKWLEKCPYKLELYNNVRDKWSNVTYDTIRSSNFHLLIETHYDQKEYVSDNKIYSRDFSPSSITEKAYKPIACRTPFIAFATPNWLEDLRALGFKTYAPYINEDYDKETDSNKRLNMIVSEIERICSLGTNEYTELVNNCKAIAEENVQILAAKINAQENK